MKKILLGVVVAAIAATAAQAITYGQADGGRHPMVGALVGTFDDGTYPYCSGALISPTVFLTAAHCDIGTSRVNVTFDEAYTSSAKLYKGTFHANTAYTQSQDDPQDLAVVVFAKPIKGITPAKLPTARLLDRMKADGTLNQGSRFTSVGYGGQEVPNGAPVLTDEPIAGVDRGSQARFRDSLVHLIEEHGAGVLLVSHELSAVAETIDRVVVLKRTVVFDGSPAELAERGVSLGIHPDDLPLWLEGLQ